MDKSFVSKYTVCSIREFKHSYNDLFIMYTEADCATIISIILSFYCS